MTDFWNHSMKTRWYLPLVFSQHPRGGVGGSFPFAEMNWLVWGLGSIRELVHHLKEGRFCPGWWGTSVTSLRKSLPEEIEAQVLPGISNSEPVLRVLSLHRQPSWTYSLHGHLQNLPDWEKKKRARERTQRQEKKFRENTQLFINAC